VCNWRFPDVYAILLVPGWCFTINSSLWKIQHTYLTTAAISWLLKPSNNLHLCIRYKLIFCVFKQHGNLLSFLTFHKITILFSTKFCYFIILSYPIQIYAGPFLCNFVLMWLENLYHLSNLRDNVWFNAICHELNVAAVLCWRLAESDVTVISSVTCMDWWYW